MKIGVVGCGHVGAASAYACVMRGVGTEIVLVDMNKDLAIAQAEDILHATPFSHPVPCRAGTYKDLKGAGIVMIAAGVGQRPGETRLDLLKRNAAVFGDIIPQILAAAPSAILLIASNPVDVMTHMAALISGGCCSHDHSRIIGSGTILDTARFRSLLGQHLGVSSHSVHGYVLGEHGDSEVLHWSGTTVGNLPLADFAAQVEAPVTDSVRTAIDNGVRRAADRIIAGKGATWFGIGAGMARIAQAIVDDEHAVLTCCTPVDDIEGIPDVCLSLPHVVSAAGIERTIYPALNDAERGALRRSAEILKEAIEAVGL
ncbi:MAG: L-lactate dehydrogenase [Rhodospirillales bacterium]|nr:L-lactate dehydrogenase [Rhodospirillales bacterium]